MLQRTCVARLAPLSRCQLLARSTPQRANHASSSSRDCSALSKDNRCDNRSAFEQCVGNTRLVRLSHASKLTGCEIYGKAEYENPGGSIKDRAALHMIRGAERDGLLTRGKPGVIVEGTAGNTGIGLALAGQVNSLLHLDNSSPCRTRVVICITIVDSFGDER